MIDREKVISKIKTICEICKENKWMTEFTSDVIYPILSDALALLKEQEAEIRQLKLALDIAKGTCKGIIVETDEKYMGDL